MFDSIIWDVYSGVIRSLHEKYSKRYPSSFRDWELLSDYKEVERGISSNLAEDARAMAEELEKEVERGISSNLAEDARAMAEELEDLLEAEIERRMNKWRRMANRATTEFYDMLTREEM